MGTISVILTILLVLVTLAMIGIILLQRGKGGGLVAMGGGGVDQAFGTHAANMAQKITAVLAILFLVFAVALGKLHKSRSASDDPSFLPAPPVAPAPESSPETSERTESEQPAQKETEE